MAASTATNIGLQYAWALGEDGWNTGMDSNLLKLDSLVQPNVIDSTINTPPGSPTTGDKYIVATGGSGAWSGLDAKFVIWTGSAWVSCTAKEGWIVYDQTNNYYLKFNGSTWVQDPFGDRAYADAATAVITQTGAIATALFINRLDHFIGDEDPACFTVTSFTNPQSWSDTDRGNITGANAWRGVAKHAVSTSSGQRLFNFGGGYGDSVAGSATATLNWVAGDKYQFIWRGAISAVPDGSNQFCLTFGFSTRGGINGYNPPVTAGYSHACIWADESSGFWKCYSRSATGATEESTTTAVAVAANTEITIHVVIATTGNVEFYINNSLVATHSGGGKIQAGDKLIPQLAWYNKATIAATRYLYSDCVGYLMVFSSQAAGLAWR